MLMTGGDHGERGGGDVEVKLYFIEETLIFSGRRKGATLDGEGREGRGGWVRAGEDECSLKPQLTAGS